MGRHARQAGAGADAETVGFTVVEGVIGLYPLPDETPEDRAGWLDRSWTLFRGLAMDDRLFGLMPYESEVGSKPAIDPRSGRRRGRRGAS